MNNSTATGLNINKGENSYFLKKIQVPLFDKDIFFELTRSVRDKLAALAVKSAQPVTREVLELLEVSGTELKVAKESNGGGAKKSQSKKKANLKAKEKQRKAENYALHQKMAAEKNAAVKIKKIYTLPFTNHLKPSVEKNSQKNLEALKAVVEKLPNLLNALAATLEAFAK